MDYPTFKLEGVVKSRAESLEDFEGPLTLILQLLSKNKIEIKDIQISTILDQYLEYLDRMASMDLDIASEFVAMASHLVYIKTRMLLDTNEEISELDELISSLETLKAKNTYAKIRSMTDTLDTMYRKGAGYITKPPEYIKSLGEYRYFHETEDILNAILSVLSRDNGGNGITSPVMFAVPERTVYPVSEKSDQIIKSLKSTEKMTLITLFSLCESRTELVATFLSILELCRAGSICIEGDVPNELVVRLNGNNNENGRQINGQ